MARRGARVSKELTRRTTDGCTTNPTPLTLRYGTLYTQMTNVPFLKCRTPPFRILVSRTAITWNLECIAATERASRSAFKETLLALYVQNMKLSSCCVLLVSPWSRINDVLYNLARFLCFSQVVLPSDVEDGIAHHARN